MTFIILLLFPSNAKCIVDGIGIFVKYLIILFRGREIEIEGGCMPDVILITVKKSYKHTYKIDVHWNNFW